MTHLYSLFDEVYTHLSGVIFTLLSAVIRDPSHVISDISGFLQSNNNGDFTFNFVKRPTLVASKRPYKSTYT